MLTKPFILDLASDFIWGGGRMKLSGDNTFYLIDKYVWHLLPRMFILNIVNEG